MTTHSSTHSQSTEPQSIEPQSIEPQRIESTHRRTRPRRRIVALATGMLALPASAAMAVGGTSATAEEAPPPIAVQMLAKHSAFPDDVSVQVKRKLSGQGADVLNLKDAGQVVTARLVVQPGAAFPWHTHPGPVIVSVTQGDLVYQQASDCIERTYGVQEAFVDPGTKVHTAWNPGEKETVLVATFFGVPKKPDGSPGAVTIPDPDQSDRCD